MPAPSLSIPARITASAACMPPPQPMALAASAARAASSADASAASASRSPLFPVPAGQVNCRRPRRAAPGGPRRSPRSPARSVRSPPRTACRRRSRGAPCPAPRRSAAWFASARPPTASTVPRPVPGMIWGRARAVRLAAAPVGLADAARAEIPGPGQLLIQPVALAFKLVKRLRHPSSRSGSVITSRLLRQPAPIQDPYETDVHPQRVITRFHLGPCHPKRAAPRRPVQVPRRPRVLRVRRGSGARGRAGWASCGR